MADASRKYLKTVSRQAYHRMFQRRGCKANAATVASPADNGFERYGLRCSFPKSGKPPWSPPAPPVEDWIKRQVQLKGVPGSY